LTGFTTFCSKKCSNIYNANYNKLNGIKHDNNKPKAEKTKLDRYGDKNWNNREKAFEVVIAGGIKQIYPPNSPKYGVGIFTTDYLWPIKKKSLFTIGTDAFFDGSHNAFLKQDSVITDGIDGVLRGGIHVGYGLKVGKCTGILQTGYYLYNPHEIDGRIYNTLSIRYHLNDHWFVCFNLKSHYARADYFQYGIGYHL
jgi:hypothetical protein